MVSIRDYIVDKCIERGESVLIKYNNLQMLLTPDQLEKGTRGTEKYMSKYDDRVYSLVDFDWDSPIQEGLFDEHSNLSNSSSAIRHSRFN